jgi:hypothetical protein
VIDEALPHDRHRLEAAVRMLRKAGHDLAVIHAKAVLDREILSEIASSERRIRPHPLVALRVAIEMVDAEKEGVGGFPGKPEWRNGEHFGCRRGDLGRHEDHVGTRASAHKGPECSRRSPETALRRARDTLQWLSFNKSTAAR